MLARRRGAGLWRVNRGIFRGERMVAKGEAFLALDRKRLTLFGRLLRFLSSPPKSYQ